MNNIKVWLPGTPRMQDFLPDARSTWAISNDKDAVGTVERKYITDIIARPYPQCIAVDIQSFKYDFATRSLDIFLKSDNSKGASQLFIGANRHYPDGFSIVINESFVLCHNPLKKVGLEVFKSTETSNPADFIWDENKQQLHIQKWQEDKAELHVRIIPGVNN